MLRQIATGIMAFLWLQSGVSIEPVLSSKGSRLAGERIRQDLLWHRWWKQACLPHPHPYNDIY